MSMTIVKDKLTSGPGQQELRLYADACSSRFALKREGEWVREFSSLPEAIRFVAHLPHEGTLHVILHDDHGLPLTRFALRPC